MEGASADTAPRNTNTQKHFVTTLVGLIKFKQVEKKNHVTQTVFFNLHKKIEEKANENEKSSSHVTIPRSWV